MRHLFLVNPAAGKGKNVEGFCKAAEEACSKRGLRYEIKVSEKPGDITAWAMEAGKTGEEYRIYACGGDGTLNEAVSGAAGFYNLALTHVARGSGNDFIRQFTDTAPFRDIDALLDDTREIAIDLVDCNGEHAVNICSVGFDARVAVDVSGYKQLPLVTGSGAYILSCAANVIKGIHHPYEVEIDGEVIEGDETLVCVANGSWYGGGFHPVPQADPTDGLLDILIVKGVSRMTILKVVGAYRQGKYRDFPQYIEYRKARQVRVVCREEEPINLDGELRYSRIISFSVAPFRLRFFYPGSVSLAILEEKEPAAAGR